MTLLIRVKSSSFKQNCHPDRSEVESLPSSEVKGGLLFLSCPITRPLIKVTTPRLSSRPGFLPRSTGQGNVCAFP